MNNELLKDKIQTAIDWCDCEGEGYTWREMEQILKECLEEVEK